MTMPLGTALEPKTHREPDKALIRAYVSRRQSQGYRTLRKIPYCLHPLLEWLADSGGDLQSLTPAQAEDYQAWLVTKETEGRVHYASQSVRDMINITDGFYAYLRDTGLVPTNPFHGMARVRSAQILPRFVPSPKEMAELLNTLRRFGTEPQLGKRRSLYKLHVVAELMYSTGLRLSEVAALEVRDIDFRSSVVTVREGKGGGQRQAYLNDYAREVLRIYVEQMRSVVNHKAEGETLFGVSSGKNLDHWLNTWLKKTCGLTSHTFRHAVGTHLLQRGCDLRFIQLILGHEDLKSTALYTKITKEDLKDQLDRFHPRS